MHEAIAKRAAVWLPVSMSRSSRLFELLQTLRRHRRPVSAATLAGELGVSTRTIYRDIGVLVSHGATIDGEAGVGYVLKPGFLLPPLMFEPEEIEALMLGLRFVVQRGDDGLSAASANAAAKLRAVLPSDLREMAARVGSFAAPLKTAATPPVDLALLRRAIRSERKMRLVYRKAAGPDEGGRCVWPVALAFFDQVRVLVAWCELRSDFRHFRMDRIVQATMLPERYPLGRAALFGRWREQEGVPEPL